MRETGLEEKKVTFLCSAGKCLVVFSVFCHTVHLPNNQLPQTCLLQKKFKKWRTKFWQHVIAPRLSPRRESFISIFLWELTCEFVFSDPLYHGAFLVLSPHPTYPPAQLLVVIRLDIWAKKGRKEGRLEPQPIQPPIGGKRRRFHAKCFQKCACFWKYSFCAKYIRCCFFTVTK